MRAPHRITCRRRRGHLPKPCVRDAARRRRRKSCAPRPCGAPRCGPLAGVGARWAASLAIMRRHAHRSGSLAQFPEAATPEQQKKKNSDPSPGRSGPGRSVGVRVGHENFSPTSVSTRPTRVVRKSFRAPRFRGRSTEKFRLGRVGPATTHRRPKNSADPCPSADRPKSSPRYAATCRHLSQLPPRRPPATSPHTRAVASPNSRPRSCCGA
jgi:hypothetical protein